jgi:hypothetical protein
MPGHTEWAPGFSGNPNGRPLGKRDNKYRKYQEAAEQEKLECPVLFLHRKLQDESIDLALRAQMAANIAPYYYPKWGTISPPPVPIFNEHSIGLQPPTTVESIKSNITKLIAAYDNGEIDQASYDRLFQGQVSAANILLGQDKLNAAHADTRDTTIHITGGLPTLPLGPNDGPLLMPELNGHKSYELVEHQSSGNGPSPSPSVGAAPNESPTAEPQE